MTMALEGIKVLDLSRLAPGPYCSMLLADFGADVTLVEAVPGSSAKLGGGQRRGDSAERAAAYNALGRGKKSITLNLKETEAREIFYKLADDADVVLEGFRPGVVARLGVDYETLSKRNPRIVYCSLSGFGQTGPYSNLVGHDINYISVGGALGVTGRPGT
ncbi:MAG: CoA transferase, partial [Dehalococcoidia bacterium]|nr:CoA transferase [Dehalococcoidia bacterium]